MNHSMGHSTSHLVSNVVFFDGVCNLCNTSVQWLIDHDHHNRLRFAPLQGTTYKEISQHYPDLPEDVSSIVLFDGNQFFTQSDAALRIAMVLGGVWSLARVFFVVPKFVRDAVYNVIAQHRYRWFGRADECRIPTPELWAKFLA